ncbi:MAG TPA: UDP-3-O-(3-hydroxymyristoyl)glucosamine N-acyltransferase [Candidatus Binatia bacterium]|nr:UDP-3-O-(3-hydroxymyristoyl)glucosamine N-acyltransferase [Candidatus Binatia bacterium]
MTAPGKTLSELAQQVGGKVIGDGRIVIHKVASIEEAGPGEIAFLANSRYQPLLGTSKASAVIVGPGIASAAGSKSQRAYLEASDPYVAFAKILRLFNPPVSLTKEVSSQAHIDREADLESGVTVFPRVFVGKGAWVGAGTVLYPGVFLGERVRVGKDCVLHPNVVVRDGCRIGSRVVLHAGVVIGSDGFGYAGEGEQRVKIPQVGIVEIEDDVEIGANTTVDRATLGRTLIGRGVKIDNLVQIAHNVVVGDNSVIASQAGIAGSTRIGKKVMLGGQVGIINHLTIGDGSMIGPGSGILRSVPPGAIRSSGLDAAPHREWLKVVTLLPQLPRLWRVVWHLEKKVAELVKSSHNPS